MGLPDDQFRRGELQTQLQLLPNQLGAHQGIHQS